MLTYLDSAAFFFFRLGNKANNVPEHQSNALALKSRRTEKGFAKVPSACRGGGFSCLRASVAKHLFVCYECFRVFAAGIMATGINIAALRGLFARRVDSYCSGWTHLASLVSWQNHLSALFAGNAIYHFSRFPSNTKDIADLAGAYDVFG